MKKKLIFTVIYYLPENVKIDISAKEAIEAWFLEDLERHGKIEIINEKFIEE